MIISIIRVTGGSTSNGAIDITWVMLWYDMEAAIAIIVVSVTAFRALFVAHQAMKYRSPAENASTPWGFWSNRKGKILIKKELRETPSPVLGGVQTRIRSSQYDERSFDRGSDELELQLQEPGITVTQHVHMKKVRPAPSFHQEITKIDVKSRHLGAASRDPLRNPLSEP